MVRKITFGNTPISNINVLSFHVFRKQPSLLHGVALRTRQLLCILYAKFGKFHSTNPNMCSSRWSKVKTSMEFQFQNVSETKKARKTHRTKFNEFAFAVDRSSFSSASFSKLPSHHGTVREWTERNDLELSSRLVYWNLSVISKPFSCSWLLDQTASKITYLSGDKGLDARRKVNL